MHIDIKISIILEKSYRGYPPILTYMYAKWLNIVVCQDFCFHLFISNKKKGNLHKQNLHLFQQQLVQVTKLSDADMASFG